VDLKYPWQEALSFAMFCPTVAMFGDIPTLVATYIDELILIGLGPPFGKSPPRLPDLQLFQSLDGIWGPPKEMVIFLKYIHLQLELHFQEPS
jgi:hypothetical protein